MKHPIRYYYKSVTENVAKNTPIILFIWLFSMSLNILAQTKSAYFFGNSVTDAINLKGLESLSQNAGKTLNWGRHVIPGAPLDWIWDHPNDGFNEDPYGLYPNALPNYTWSVISFQPFDRSVSDDLTAITNFVNLGKSKSPNMQIYIYGRWPRAPNNIDNADDPSLTADLWTNLFNTPYSDGWATNVEEGRDFFETLTTACRNANLGIPSALIVPVGEVMYRLNSQMKAGQIAGYSKIWNVYSDGIHFKPDGNYIASCTYYATIFKADPRGLGVPSEFGTLSNAFVTAVQNTVWDVMTTYKDPNGNSWAGISSTNIPVTGVTLNKTILSIVNGTTSQLTATVSPSNATNKTVNWLSSDNLVATVSSTGLVTGTGAGSAIITATTADQGKTAICSVTVTASSDPDIIAPSAPTLLNAGSIKDVSFLLSWTASTDNVGVIGYDVYNGATKVNEANITSTSYSVTGLNACTSYPSFTVKAKDAAGNVSTSGTLPVKTNCAPTAVLSATPSTGTSPLVVAFSAVGSTDPDAGDYILGYEWVFGDGTPNSNANAPSHTYANGGTYTATLRVMDNRDFYSAEVSKTITVAQGSATNIAPSGTASGWTNLTGAANNDTKVAYTALNNSNTNVDVVFPDASAAGNWQAAGIVWGSAQSNITSVKFYNGVCTSLANNGVFSAGIKIQSSTNGTTWTDISGWACSPAYPYSTAASNQVYTFSGSTLNGVMGIRVIGQVRTNDSWSINAKEVEVWAGTAPPATYTLTVAATNGSVGKNPNQTTYNSGTSVILNATPDTGYTFSNWSGDATGSSNPITITMNANKNITANFAAVGVGYNKETGTAYRWSKNTTATSNANKVAAPGLNNNNTSVDVGLNNGTDDVSNAYEAAGLTFTSAKTITKLEFVNGTYAGGYDNGCFEADLKIQTTTNGTTWSDATGWVVAPTYAYLGTSVSGATFTFTGSAENITGIRVTGKVHISSGTGSWEARCREISAFSGSSTGSLKNALVNETITDVTNIKQQGLLVYPNPVLDVVHINFGTLVDNAIVTIFDIQGRKLIVMPISGVESYEADLSNIKSGVYFLKVSIGEKSEITRMVKK